MRKFTFIIFILSLIQFQIQYINKLTAQTWSNTNGPTIGTVTSFAESSAGVLFAGLGPVYLSLENNFYRSTNNGNTWRALWALSFHTYDMIYKNNYIYIATDQGMFRSSNNGDIWEGFGFWQYSYSVFSTLSNNSFYTGNSLQGIFRTTNSGTDWTKVLETDNIIKVITGDSLNNIYATDHNKLYRSSNAGDSWDSVTNINSAINCIYYAGNGIVYTGTPNLGLYSSTDYGNDWNRLVTPFSSVLAIIKNNLNELIISSESGLWKSSDNGSNWIFITGTVQNIKELFITSANLFLSGTTHGIYKSINKGSDWLNSGIKQATIYDIYTRMPGKIYSISLMNNMETALWSSTNKGVNWVKVYSTGTTLFRVAAFDSNVYAGTFGNVLRSTNSGLSFQEVYNSQSICNKIIADSLGNIFAGFDNGFYKSTNSGINWSNVNNITHIIKDIEIVNQNLMYACGSGKVYKSTDQGNNWSMIYNNNGDELVCMSATEDGHIIINSFRLTRSSDFGNTWQSIGNPFQSTRNFIFDKRNNFYCTLGDEIYKSTNYGTDFELFNDNLPGNNICIGLDTDNYLYVGTDGNSVYKTNSPLTNLSNETIKETGFSLYQNFPNPFNPSTEIKFEISKKAQVKISVFDILGKEISKLVNKEFNQGTYTIEFKGDNLASGIYFYKIEVNEFTQMKKMILMK